MAQLHLIEGPVGAGKSTLAAQLSSHHGCARLILDDWMTTLFRPDRPATGVMEWYLERKDRCIEQILKLASQLLDAGSDVILELGLIRQGDRLAFYDRMDVAGYPFTVYVLEASRETRRERVQERNAQKGSTFAMEVPDDFFEMASDLWEPPDDFESEGRDMRFIDTED